MSTLSAQDFHDRHGGNLYALFESRFPPDGDARWAIETADGRRYGFSDLREGSARVEAWLGGLGIERGARVLCQVDKSVEAVLLYLGVLRAGLCYVPLNPAYREAEVRHFLADAEPAVVVCRPADEGCVFCTPSLQRTPDLLRGAVCRRRSHRGGWRWRYGGGLASDHHEHRAES